ncbi:MAG: arsenite methyltransferase [Acidimicrobiia bacterium]|nr:arsenite methyltransferase [Acidimicrobiia bacterium]
MTDRIKASVRARYASAASRFLDRLPSQGCCASPPRVPGYGADVYEHDETDAVPDEAVLASLGCGNPTAVAELREGETVLDLGSGGGLDVLLSARRVGPTGKAYGLDMTAEMLELARRNQAEAGIENAEFLAGEIEDLPLPDDSVDVIISNCVINLSADKGRVFSEAHRVLRSGGRFAVSDVVARRDFTQAEKEDLAQWAGCMSGALTEDAYRAGLEKAGFDDVEVVVSHDLGPDLFSAIVRARA